MWEDIRQSMHCSWQENATAELHTTPQTNMTYCMQFSGIYSLSLVGRGFFSFVSVFFSLVLSNLAISVRSGLSDMLAVNRGSQFY